MRRPLLNLGLALIWLSLALWPLGAGATPQPTPTPSASGPDPQRLQAVQKLCQRALASRPYFEVGYSIIHIPSGRQISHKGQKLFPLASTFKIPVLLEACRQMQNQVLPYNIDHLLSLRRQDICIGSGDLQYEPLGSKWTVDQLLTEMIISSDNTATDMIIGQIGSAPLRDFMPNLGLTHNRIFLTNRQAWLLSLGCHVGLPSSDPEKIAAYWQKLAPKEQWKLAQEVEREHLTLERSLFQDWEDRSGNYYSEAKFMRVAQTVDNLSSPQDFSLLLAKLWRGEVLTPSWTEYALSILGRQRSRSRLPRLLPPQTAVYHKTGTIAGVVNDSGILISKRGHPLAVTVFVQGANSSEINSASQLIGELAKIAWDNL